MSLYRITEKPSAFSVEHFAYDRVTVELQPWAFSVTSDGYPERRCGFFGQDRLKLLIASRLLGEADAVATPTDSVAPLPRQARAAKAMHTDVCRQRIRLLAQVDPAVHQVQLTALRLAGRIPALAQDPALYREPYVLREILNHRAAAIALAYLHSELSSGQADLSVEALMAAMANWRGLFSPDGMRYGSLNRTLMNLPGDVPPETVCQLSKIRLERPVLHWLELNTLLTYASLADAAPPDGTRFRLFHHASAAEIAEAVKRIGRCTNRELRLRRPDDLRFVVRYLCDYPEPFHGTLAGLVERVLRWHRYVYERERLQREIKRLGGYRRSVAHPSVPLPAVPGVTFLGTVGEIVEEGERMRHRIATRAEDAIRGRCHLFHIDYDGERASVEVSAQGKIVQAKARTTRTTLRLRGAPRSFARGVPAYACRKSFVQPHLSAWHAVREPAIRSNWHSRFIAGLGRSKHLPMLARDERLSFVHDSAHKPSRQKDFEEFRAAPNPAGKLIAACNRYDWQPFAA